MALFNATLFVQMFNFVVAWKVLDKFLFKSCVAEIHKEDEAQSALQDRVGVEKRALKKVEDEYAHALEGIRMRFSAALPPIAQDLSLKTIPQDTFSFVRECDVTSRQRVTQEVVELLVKRITHV